MVVERADVVDVRGGGIAESTSADVEISTEDVAGEDTGDVLELAASPRSGEGAGSVPAHAHSTMVATAAVVAVLRIGIGLTITSPLNGIAESVARSQPPSGSTTPPPPEARLFLRVDDFEAARRRMLDYGVEFVTESRDEDYGRVAVFVDVAGNRWDLLGPRR